MNVLSLFDGMSCGMIALDRLGIKVDNYYASEIDKYAMQVSAANYPEIIQVGDITKLDLSTLPQIDLVMGGSPCQGFSFAGKQLAFDDPRSMLFFEFVKCVKELNPKYFLLENVRMKKEYLDIISEYMGVDPIFINSSLVSAQSRQRYYWTNIPNVEQPEERGIVLRDILQDQLVDDTSDLPEKSFVIKANYYKSSKANFENDTTKGCKFSATGIPQKLVRDKPQRVGTHVEQVKVRKHEVDITALQYLLREMKVESKKTNRQIAEETNLPITKVEHWFRTDSSFAIPSDDVWLKLKEVLAIPVDTFDAQIMDFEYRDGVFESTQRVYGDHGKSPTLTASNSDQLIQTSDKPQKIHDIPKDVLKDNERQRRVYSKEGKSPTLLARADSPKVMKSDKPQHIATAMDINGHDILKRVYSPDGKSPTVTTCGGGNTEPKVVVNNVTCSLNKDHKLTLTRNKDQEVYWRKLLPLECERLQTVPDNYTNHVSNSQRYKMLGNGWTIEVIAHILQNMDPFFDA